MRDDKPQKLIYFFFDRQEFHYETFLCYEIKKTGTELCNKAV